MGRECALVRQRSTRKRPALDLRRDGVCYTTSVRAFPFMGVTLLDIYPSVDLGYESSPDDAPGPSSLG
jgi:hypothetical protein